MRTVIDWSHQLLDDEERSMFRRLAVFAGPFDLGSAAMVASHGDVVKATDLIGRLADKSLLARGQDGAQSRWRMLDTVRAYAAEQLDASADAAKTRCLHLSWAAATAKEIEQLLDDGDEWEQTFDSVSDDLRAALQGSGDGPGDGVDFPLALGLGRLELRAALSGRGERPPESSSRQGTGPGIRRYRPAVRGRDRFCGNERRRGVLVTTSQLY